MKPPRNLLSLSLVAACLPLATPRAQTFDTAAAALYSEKQNGHALLIYKDGKLLFEKYGNGWTQSQAHRLASGTKSFTVVLLMAAAEDGLLKIDDKVSLTLTEWKTDKRKSQITYRQLVGLVSGLWGGRIGTITSYAGAVATKTIADPAKAFSYGPNPFQSFGEALKRILAKQSKKETVYQYLQRRLLTPIGIKVGSWRNSSTGEPDLPSGAFLTAREWIKFGEMVRLGGMVGNKRVLKASSLKPCFLSTSVNKNYGVGWWLPAGTSNLPADLAAALGAGKQCLFVIPSMGLTIVRFGESKGYRWSNYTFFATLMPAQHKRFGKGCAGSAGTPSLTGQVLRSPVYGQSLGVDLGNLVSKAAGVLYLGFSKESLGSFKLPLDLGPLGMKGCSLYTSLEILFPFITSGSSTSFRVPLPLNPGLIGHSLYFQALLADSKANTTGLVLSNALESRIGLK